MSVTSNATATSSSYRLVVEYEPRAASRDCSTGALLRRGIGARPFRETFAALERELGAER